MRNTLPFALLGLVAVACGDKDETVTDDTSVEADADTDTDTDTDADSDPGQDPEVTCTSKTGLVNTTTDGDGWLTTLDSSDLSGWTCMTFEDGSQANSDWSLAWQSWTAVMPQGVKGQVIDNGDYDALTTAPAGGYSGANTTLFGDWFNYDPNTHVLTPHPKVYVIKDLDGDYWKLEVTSYYGDDGQTVHNPVFRWAALNAP